VAPRADEPYSCAYVGGSIEDSVYICCEPRKCISSRILLCRSLQTQQCKTKIRHETSRREWPASNNESRYYKKKSETICIKNYEIRSRPDSAANKTLHRPPRPLLRRTTKPKHLAIFRGLGLSSSEHRTCRYVAEHDIPTATFGRAHQTWRTSRCVVRWF
jgi:hypothetical protein